MPDVPVVGTEVFDLKFAKAHKQELTEIYNLLYDEKSKDCFYNLIMFKLTGDIEYLFNCETNEENEFFNIINPNKNDNYLDLGAYNGDTVLQYINRISPTGLITAVEPDKKSFKKLIKNTEGFNVNCINAAITNKNGTVLFNTQGNRGSAVGEGNGIDSVTIDFLSQKTQYNFILMA